MAVTAALLLSANPVYPLTIFPTLEIPRRGSKMNLLCDGDCFLV
jgi:hypothetical protein